MAGINAQAPQPKTFAPSREDVLSTLAYFFGAPVSPEKLVDYNEHHAQVSKGPAYHARSTQHAQPIPPDSVAPPALADLPLPGCGVRPNHALESSRTSRHAPGMLRACEGPWLTVCVRRRSKTRISAATRVSAKR